MESREREAYRKGCRHHSRVSDLCCKKSHYYCKGALTIAVDVACTPDCDCARMRRFDKRRKD